MQEEKLTPSETLPQTITQADSQIVKPTNKKYIYLTIIVFLIIVFTISGSLVLKYSTSNQSVNKLIQNTESTPTATQTTTMPLSLSPTIEVLPLSLTPTIKVDSNILYQNHYLNFDCNSLEGWFTPPDGDMRLPEKDVCSEERAVNENNPSFCEINSDSNTCITRVVIKHGDLNVCQFIKNKNGSFWIKNQLKDEEKDNAGLYDCYRAVANWRNDPSICNKIPYKEIEELNNCKETAKNWKSN